MQLKLIPSNKLLFCTWHDERFGMLLHRSRKGPKVSCSAWKIKFTELTGEDQQQLLFNWVIDHMWFYTDFLSAKIWAWEYLFFSRHYGFDKWLAILNVNMSRGYKMPIFCPVDGSSSLRGPVQFHNWFYLSAPYARQVFTSWGRPSSKKRQSDEMATSNLPTKTSLTSFQRSIDDRTVVYKLEILFISLYSSFVLLKVKFIICRALVVTQLSERSLQTPKDSGGWNRTIRKI